MPGIINSFLFPGKSNLFTWGDNIYGELGLGMYAFKNIPTPVISSIPWIELDCGGDIWPENHQFSLAIKNDGTLWAWGSSISVQGVASGALGLGPIAAASTPMQVGTDRDWKKVSCESYWSGGIKNDGTLWFWGWVYLSYNQLTVATTPIQIGTDTDWVDISISGRIILARKSTGIIWVFRYFPTEPDGYPHELVSTISPGNDVIFNDWVYMCAAEGYAFAIRNDGTLWGWGSNQNYALGIGDTIPIGYNAAFQLNTDTDWVQVSGGAGHGLAIKNNGTLWSWGYNYSGQCGQGFYGGDVFSGDGIKVPTQVGTDTDWVHVEAGAFSSYALKQNGVLYSCGYNGPGQLGIGNSLTNTNIFTPISKPTSWITFKGSYRHAGGIIGVAAPKALWSWGDGSYGQLGLNDKDPRNIPTIVSNNISTTWDKLGGGGYNAMAIKSDGTLWGWGHSTYSGQLGLNTTTDYSSPIQVGTLTDWKTISSGCGWHTLAIKANGTLWGWGANEFGQLGNNTPIILYSSPVQIGTDTNWNIISTGQEFSAGIRNDGTLWTWGYNGRGQLGTNDFYWRSSPTHIGTGSTWKLVASGKYYSLAIKTDGTLWGWGDWERGTLGFEIPYFVSSVTQIGSSSDWKLVSCGLYYSMAIKTDNTLWGWGTNWNGNQYVLFSSSPIQIGTLTNWKNIASGNGQALAIKTDGTLWGWGNNSNGQLGTGDTIFRSSPVQIGNYSNWTNIRALRESSLGTTK